MAIGKLLLLVCLTSIFAGCATPQKQLAREEWLQIRNQRFANIPADKVLNAAEQIFKLSDNNDFRFSYNNNSLTAVRWAAPFPVHVWYHWNIETEQQESDTKVNVSISTTAFGFGVPDGMTPHDSPDVINLFYSRLGYLLGENGVWYSCEEYKSSNPQASTLEALCLLAEDSRPNSRTKLP